ncbi:hypothetical protein GGD66_005841 [Bradyrhizobium sp. CIR48]|uniref:hypothetical protein n=1 Tax=unclassified Bradyrhizobium TaxID=2631580 RepID=UPI0012FB749A|nr:MULTISPECIES: hypothetical protein [unclassified Bradyrhizobium]MBB4396283.1 hypothetical protein [Bradyrhizobium sp. ERR14]MBB4427259.1 hypothetical protein [Bradyrhizobium sp. CIR48]
MRRTRDAFAFCARHPGNFGNAPNDSGSFTKAKDARADVLQSSEMIGHGSGGHELKCRIPPASNVKKKQEFA